MPTWLPIMPSHGCRVPGSSSPTFSEALRTPSLRPRKIARARCGAQQFVVFEVVAELGAFLFLAGHHAGAEHGFLLEKLRSFSSRAASSAKRSMRMYLAPSRAALTSATPFSASTKRAASLSGASDGSLNRPSASSPRPASRAIWPLVRRFCLYGR
jgi:hypothetical protein